MDQRLFRYLSALSAIVGVVLLVVSFSINPGPPEQATSEQLAAFGRQYFTSILWGAWLQAVGPLLIVLFAFALVVLAGATGRFAGWATMFGASVLMTVSLIEITFYIGALFVEPVVIGPIALGLIHAVQHLYFIVGAPALFFPLGAVLLQSTVLPRAFGYLAIALAAAFAAAGILFLTTLILPVGVQAFAGVQTVWWLGAAFSLIARTRRSNQP
jgi:hypothetical protein